VFFFAILLYIRPSHAESVRPHYQIGPADILSIYIWKEPDLTREVTVMADGRISFPLLGEVMAQGETVTSLKDMITEKIRKFVTAPEVTVIVKESRSRRIYTIGKLNQPGPYALAPEMTILQALSTAGGLNEWADQKNILIVRKEGKDEVQYRFNYKEYTSGKDLKQNIVLMPNDTIVVP
jgi:polysaccharide export outer membrane protein